MRLCGALTCDKHRNFVTPLPGPLLVWRGEGEEFLLDDYPGRHLLPPSSDFGETSRGVCPGLFSFAPLELRSGQQKIIRPLIISLDVFHDLHEQIVDK